MSYDANFGAPWPFVFSAVSSSASRFPPAAMLEDERVISLPRGLKPLTLTQGLDALDDMPDAKQERDQTARPTLAVASSGTCPWSACPL